MSISYRTGDMAFELCEIMSKLKPMALSGTDKLVSSRKDWSWNWNLNLNFNFLVFVITSLILLIPVHGKVLTNQKYYVNQVSGLEDTREFPEIFDEYYEDSFEDLLLKHNFVEEYDTDGEVRFITEDDVEESYKDEGEFPSREARIAHLDPKCPELPQPSKLTKNLCQAKSCLNDDDCTLKYNSKNSKSISTLVCCFNGCLSSCLPRVDPPKAFDWLEDTEIRTIQNANGTIDRDAGPSTLNPKALLTDEITVDKISLPGGCYITQEQLDELRLFRKYDHVEVCTCLNGEVVCQINPRVAIKADELQGSRLPI